MQNKRYQRQLKIKKRWDILRRGGFQQGSLYEKHVSKVCENRGYLSKSGTLLHYGAGTKPTSQKVRDRKSYSGTTNWSVKDLRRLQRGVDDESSYD